MPFPTNNFFILGGARCPGKATLVSATKIYGWEIRKGNALTGATVVPTGDELVEAKFLVEVWSAEDYIGWLQFAAKFLSNAIQKLPGTTSSKAMRILHQQLNGPPLNVTEVVAKAVNPLANDGYGLWSGEIVFLQYRRPRAALPRPNGTIDATGGRPTAEDKQDVQINALLDRLAAVPQ